MRMGGFWGRVSFFFGGRGGEGDGDDLGLHVLILFPF